MPPLLYPFRQADGRLRVLPDDPQAIVGPRPRDASGKPSRRPHTDATVAKVRRLVEQTTLTYGEIAKKSGVGRASICRWTRDGRWQRPLFAPRATDTVPRPRAGARLKLRTLAARLAALAERAIGELEASACVDPGRLGEALELYKMAKLASLPRKRKRPRTTLPPLIPANAGIQEPQIHEQAALDSRVRGNERRELSYPQKREARLVSNAGTQEPQPTPVIPAQAGIQESQPTPLVPAKAGTQGPQVHAPAALDSRVRGNERDGFNYPQLRLSLTEDLRAAGVDVARAPRDALEDYIESHVPARDFPELRPRGRRSRRNRAHVRMYER